MKIRIKQILFTIPTLVSLILTLLLLTYVGFGEAKRTYSKFQLKKISVQAEIIKFSIASFLQAGLPLSQYSGFSSQSSGLLSSDPSIYNISVVDSNNRLIFFRSRDMSIKNRENFELISSKIKYEATKFSLDKTGSPYKVEESQDYFKVIYPLESKFGVAGYVVIESGKKEIYLELIQQYRIVFIGFIGLSLFFVLFIIFYELYAQNRENRKKILETLYVFNFITMSLLIGFSVFQIYGEGAKANTKALSDSMGQRLNQVIELGIDIKDISGIDNAFDNYKNSNPNINSIALIENNINIVHTDKSEIGKKYNTKPRSYEYVVRLEHSKENKKREFRVAVSIPYNVIFKAILASARNFVVLFVACGLISIIFFNVSAQLLILSGKKEYILDFSDYKLSLLLVKPAYFLVVFVNSLSVSFLPRLVEHIITDSGLAKTYISFPFTIYYFLFALVLIPAGAYAEKGSLKKLMGAGFFAEIIGLSIIAVTDNFWVLTFARCASGIGQGLFLIGLQSYLLVVAPVEKRTEGAAIKVNGRNAALIAGTSIGALLYSYMDYNKLFLISAVTGMVSFIYLITLVPKEKEHTSSKKKEKKENIFKDTVAVLKDSEFVKTLFFIGLTGKIMIAGIVMFSMPLVMGKLKFSSEDIGQALMLFYIFSMVTTHYSSIISDKFGNTKLVLFFSAVIGAFSMTLLGFIGNAQTIDTLLLPGLSFLLSVGEHFNAILSGNHIIGIKSVVVICLLFAGISNGLLSAPIITHINKTEVAKKYGNKSVSATYTFLERMGHVMGPMVMNYMFIATNQSNIAITFFGIITLILGILFILTAKIE